MTRRDILTTGGLALTASASSTLSAQRIVRWRTLDGRQPLVIGHRGASGYLPEHTIESYRRAIEIGADFVEPDLVSTKDGHLIARHEPMLDDTTDVNTLSEFASKKTTKTLDGVKTTAFFASDFTLAEIKQLRAIQPRASRPQQFNGLYQIPTLAEIIEMVQGENSRRARIIGIYPETKHPSFHAALGLPQEEALIAILERFGWNARNAPVFIQSFETGNLKYLRTRTKVKLVQLLDADDVGPDGKLTFAAPYDKPYNHAVVGDARGFGDLTTPSNLAEIATYADGIGPWKPYIASFAGSNTTPITTSLIADAHAAGLLVHAYTFRNDSLPAQYQGQPKDEYNQFFLYGLDGLFTDFVDTAFAAREALQLVLP
ncbi:MAG: glycerophosphodiester phosphodiesterase [Bryobacteraceae bacterium]